MVKVHRMDFANLWVNTLKEMTESSFLKDTIESL